MNYYQENRAVILQYAELAKYAYDKDTAILSRYGKNVFIKTLPDLDIKFFVVTDKKNKVQWISVRGTANFENAKLDAQCIKTHNDILGIYIHEGFNKSACDVYKTLIPKLVAGYELRFTGHSLGGAIAAILMLMCKETGFKVGKTITYGQPKVTNRKGMKKYADSDLLRVVHDEDPVPLVPPTDIFTFLNHGIYRHIGEELSILDHGKGYRYYPKSRASAIFLSSFWTHLGKEQVADHFMQNYLDWLTNNKT